MSYPRENAFDRLFNRTIVLDNGCWEFIGARHTQGYGLLRYNGKQARAHRVAYDLVVGDIPDGIQVLHICDNPPCVNPEHLFLGTDQDNMNDKVMKGRHSYGEAHGKLTNNQVLEMRKLFGTGISDADIARRFNISEGAMRHIKHG